MNQQLILCHCWRCDDAYYMRFRLCVCAYLFFIYYYIIEIIIIIIHYNYLKLLLKLFNNLFSSSSIKNESSFIILIINTVAQYSKKIAVRIIIEIILTILKYYWHNNIVISLGSFKLNYARKKPKEIGAWALLLYLHRNTIRSSSSQVQEDSPYPQQYTEYKYST